MLPLDQTFTNEAFSTGLVPGSPDLTERFRHVRAATTSLVAGLSPEDVTPQSMPDASPAKWHLAHTTWFFETFILLPLGAAPFDPAFQYLFNSYYEALGRRHPRNARGLVTRPGLAEVLAYRDAIDERLGALLAEGALSAETRELVTLGLSHEEQHQELLLTDILHLFSQNPLRPAYRRARTSTDEEPAPLSFTAVAGGMASIGHAGGGFAFDNEGPRHDVFLRPFELADRLVTNSEWKAFMLDGGYQRADLWLADGWAQKESEGWNCPIYWEQIEGEWSEFGFGGLHPVTAARPVSHVSFYEADAFARWSGSRLPTEQEWEWASLQAGEEGAWMDDVEFAPRVAQPGGLSQMFGDVWEWTASPYIGYPGFKPAPGAVGEYNGKFMINQMVLRGGSCLTPKGHVRRSYRNFFQPHQRWQMAGLRLARD